MTTIANGEKLTPETFADFVTRLRHDVKGEGVKDHYTADAIFIVQARKIIGGIDRDYTDNTMLIVDSDEYFSPQEYWDSLGGQERKHLNKLANEEYESDFLALEEWQQWNFLDDLPDHTVTGWDETWEYVNAHMTKAAAEAFIQRKKHDYRKGLRVYVESQCYCWEYSTIIAALMSGELVLKGGTQ